MKHCKKIFLIIYTGWKLLQLLTLHEITMKFPLGLPWEMEKMDVITL